jgi:hypothetical protein
MAHSKSEIRKAKNLLNKYAPKGEQLAYINPKEANLLKRMGGAGKDVNVSGIKSYFDPGSGRGSVSESLSESAGLGSSSSNNNSGGGGGSSNDNSPQPASFRSVAPKTAAPKSILSRIGDFIKGGGFTGMAIRAIGKGLKNRSNTGYNPDLSLAPSGYKFNDGSNNGGGNDTPLAMNVGGRIVKLSPTTAEVSQSGATDASPYDNRKTKAKGRSMTIMTSSRGINRNNTLTLGKPSLLGA